MANRLRQRWLPAWCPPASALMQCRTIHPMTSQTQNKNTPHQPMKLANHTSVAFCLALTVAWAPLVARSGDVSCFPDHNSEECYDRGNNHCYSPTGNLHWIADVNKPDPAGTYIPNMSCGTRKQGGQQMDCGKTAGKQVANQQVCKKVCKVPYEHHNKATNGASRRNRRFASFLQLSASCSTRRGHCGSGEVQAVLRQDCIAFLFREGRSIRQERGRLHEGR